MHCTQYLIITNNPILACSLSLKYGYGYSLVNCICAVVLPRVYNEERVSDAP